MIKGGNTQDLQLDSEIVVLLDMKYFYLEIWNVICMDLLHSNPSAMNSNNVSSEKWLNGI